MQQLQRRSFALANYDRVSIPSEPGGCKEQRRLQSTSRSASRPDVPAPESIVPSARLHSAARGGRSVHGRGGGEPCVGAERAGALQGGPRGQPADLPSSQAHHCIMQETVFYTHTLCPVSALACSLPFRGAGVAAYRLKPWPGLLCAAVCRARVDRPAREGRASPPGPRGSVPQAGVVPPGQPAGAGARAAARRPGAHRVSRHLPLP